MNLFSKLKNPQTYREPSTWKGLAYLAGALGVGVSPDQVLAIGTAVGAIIGVIDVFRTEK